MLNHTSALYRVALFARENVARSNGVFSVFWLCMPFFVLVLRLFVVTLTPWPYNPGFGVNGTATKPMYDQAGNM